MVTTKMHVAFLRQGSQVLGSHESSSGLSKPSSPTAPRDFSSTALRFCRYLSSSFPNSCRACCSIARSSGAGPSCCLPPSSSDHESRETTRVALRTGRAAMQKGRQGAVCTVAEYLPQPRTAQQARPSAPPKVFTRDARAARVLTSSWSATRRRHGRKCRRRTAPTSPRPAVLQTPRARQSPAAAPRELERGCFSD